MPKAISTDLLAHLTQAVTTLTTCWRIVRTDGVVFAFTTLDEDLVIDGVTYLSTSGFSRTAIATGSTGHVDDLQVLGFFDSAGITEDDLKRRLFDYATVYLFAVNWADLSQGILRLRRGWLGECVRGAGGAFQAELRGLQQGLTQEFNRVFSPLCRADLGDAQCKVPIKPPAWAGGVTVSKGFTVQAAVQTTDALRVAIFEAQNQGATAGSEPAWDTVVGHTTTDGGVTWLSKLPFRLIAAVTTPVDQQNFLSSVLSIGDNFGAAPNTAKIAVIDNISAGTTIEISDGVLTTGHTFPFDTLGRDAIFQIRKMLFDSTLKIAVALQGVTLTLTNTSGVVGHISKTGDSLNSIVISDFAQPPLDGGVVTWLTGDNVGKSMEMKSYDETASMVTLWLEMEFPIQAGDKFFYYQGCDKRRDTCHNTFGNILNFRGEPDMPGMDALLSYPDAG